LLPADRNKGCTRIGGKSKFSNLESNQENTRGLKEKQMGGGHANSRLEPQHHSVQSNKLHTILVNVCGRGSATKGDKTLKLANYNRDPACPNEAKEKDLLESDRLKVIANLQILGRDKDMERSEGKTMRI
jgi:hypothetical protein